MSNLLKLPLDYNDFYPDLDSILLDWLPRNDNYKRLPTVEMGTEAYNLANLAHKLTFNVPNDEGQVEVYRIGQILFTISKREDGTTDK